MINAINFSMLESPSNSYDDDTDNVVSKSTVLEPTTKHLIERNKPFPWARTQFCNEI